MICNVGFEVLTAVVMKINIFWVIMPCSPSKFNRRFGEQSSAYYLLQAGFFLGLFFEPGDGGGMFH
jgi:hypothetical protein